MVLSRASHASASASCLDVSGRTDRRQRWSGHGAGFVTVQAVVQEEGAVGLLPLLLLAVLSKQVPGQKL